MIKAEEAKKLSEEFNKKTYTQLVYNIDSQIRDAASVGHDSITLQKLTTGQKNFIYTYYTNLGYYFNSLNCAFIIHW